MKLLLYIPWSCEAHRSCIATRCGSHGLNDSTRPYPKHLPAIEYPGHFVVKRISGVEIIRLGHKLIFIAVALKHLDIELEEINDGIWAIYFKTIL